MKTMTMKSIKQYKFSLLHIFIICLSIPGMLGVVSVLSGCEDENTGDFVKGDTGYLTFSVSGHTVIQTRSGATPAQEQKVENLYMFLFNAENGNKEASVYCTGDQLVKTDEGYKVRLSDMTAGNKKVVALANIRADVSDVKQRIRITKEELDAINTLEDLQQWTAFLASDKETGTLSEDELFLMCTDVTDITLNNTGGANAVTIPLHRLMAKVEFRIIDSPGFIPTVWHVINIPSKTYLLRPASTSSLEQRDYFMEKDQKFAGTGYGDRFTFYQLESLLEPQSKITESGDRGYRKRALRKKTGNDYQKTNGEFMNAPEQVTYVVIEGEYNGPRKEGEPTMVAGNVKYTIPLGYTDNTDPVNDYKIERNTHYIYNIRVRGVNDIYVEAVRKDPEGNPDSERHPGTEGAVTEVQNQWEIDAHYEQRLLKLTEQEFGEMNLQGITCIVKTPFGTERFSLEDLKQNPKYEKLCSWVTFRCNSMATWFGKKYYYAGTQDQLNRYPANGVGNPIKSLKEILDILQKNWLWLLQNYPNRYSESETIFSYDRHEAYITVYFDEYFYETDPLTGSPVHWSKFVNTFPRELTIALQKRTSVDGQSVYYDQPLFSVRQNPIYTVYDSREAEPYYAFGTESVNETGNALLPEFNISNEEWRYFAGWSNCFSYHNNGNFGNWADLHGGNWNDQLYAPNDKKRNPFYACLYRNRDLNRNGKIDLDEVRWYVPSAIQLIDLALGDKGLPESVRLYQEDDHSGIRQHRWYVSSSPGNINNGRFPYFLWSEEGFSIGADWNPASGGDKKNGYNLRCVRSLGQIPGAHYDDQGMHTISNNIPATASSPAYVYNNNLNNRTMRLLGQFVEHGEIPKHYFKDDVSLPYRSFYVSEKNLGPYTMGELKKMLQQGTSPCENYTEKGVKHWRMPTVREMQLIADTYDTKTLADGVNRFFVSTWTEDGKYLKAFEKIGGVRKFHVYNESDDNATGYIRCVKDKE